MPKRQAWAGRETDRGDHRRLSYQGNLEEHRMRLLHQYHFRMTESQIHHHLEQAGLIVSMRAHWLLIYLGIAFLPHHS